MADSNPITKKPRNFAPGCSPATPQTAAAYRRLFQARTQQPPSQTRSFSVKTPVLGASSRSSREKEVREDLKRFRERCEILRSGKPKEPRVDMKAFAELKRTLRLGNAKSIGAVPGVEVGDRFDFRAELLIAGVHSKLQNGIDFVLVKGRPIATCVVAKVGYYDKMNDPEFLVYGGEGGISHGGGSSKKKKVVWADQKMKSGNLALKNSIEVGNHVRVLRGVQPPWKTAGGVVYVYDGLYKVEEWRRKKGDGGNMVFEFYMSRQPGQKTIDWKSYR